MLFKNFQAEFRAQCEYSLCLNLVTCSLGIALVEKKCLRKKQEVVKKFKKLNIVVIMAKFAKDLFYEIRHNAKIFRCIISLSNHNNCDW